ncbi:mechanosensitive ion channel family protein [Alsobacter sp. R-9]
MSSVPTPPTAGLIPNPSDLIVVAQVAQAQDGRPPPLPVPMGFDGSFFTVLDQWMELVGREVQKAVEAIPGLPRDLINATAQAIERSGGGWLMLQTLVAVALAALTVVAFRLWTSTTREGGLDEVACRAGASRLLLWDTLDRILFAVVLMTAGRIMMEGWGPEAGLPAACGKAAIRFYAVMLVAQVVLRPVRPRYRLVPVTDGVARRLFVIVGIGMALSVAGPTIIPVLVRNGMPWASALALALIMLTLCAILLSSGVKLAADGMARVVGPAGRNLVLLVGLVFTVGLYGTWAISILLRQFHTFNAAMMTIGILVGFGVVDATLGLEVGRDKRSRAHMVRRMFRFGTLLAMAYVLGQVWFGAQGVLPSDMWPGTRLAILYGGGTAFAGFVAWELTDYWAARAIGTTPRIDPLGGDDDAEPEPASRLATFFPMARVLAAIIIILMATLLALSNLGVNIAPLLAGAGVFGLALSFGSQSLIRDILSGVFFLGDDAFRVGEYIDTGRLKGTVEQISLRSLRLRHQNGQVHTIPYGQLQQITNFSRDWSTIKFNLRIEPTVDLEHVRKTVKKVGLAMLEDPELAREIIQPLKMQGVADIQDNAVVIRLKFTARPGRPTWVQREGLKRIYVAFREQGIPFASNAVTVRDGEHHPAPGPGTVVRPTAFSPSFGAAAGVAAASAGAALAAAGGASAGPVTAADR